VVDGEIWGAMSVDATGNATLPERLEDQLGEFTALLGTAISNAASQELIARLADEQAALRRVATLVARGVAPDAVLAAVAEEVGRLLSVEATAIIRYEADGTGTIVAVWGEAVLPIGATTELGDLDVGGQVLRTGRPARIDDYTRTRGRLGARIREVGVRSAVGSPIVVDGELWGVAVAASRQPEPLAAGTEARIGEFTGLVATAISNVQARADLAASRARIIAEADDERRRVVRDLHDGAQQRLVHSIIVLKQALRTLEPGQGSASELIVEALSHAQQANVELRDLAQGILPAALTRGGLLPAVEALASRTWIPVDVDVVVGRISGAIEATAYFVVAEALTNVAKHSGASKAAVVARVQDHTLHLAIRDDGVGGARPGGSGFVGLADRLDALDGQLRVESPPNRGTLVVAELPIPVAR
jgi:signal transduction histidine kinase